VASGSYKRPELEGSEPWLLLDDLPSPVRFAELLDLPSRS
jgi:hypothetical protein